MLVNLARLDREYYQRRPHLADPNQLVSFGSSGHRRSSLRGTFTKAHILAITQAICDYRRETSSLWQKSRAARRSGFWPRARRDDEAYCSQIR